MVAAAPVVAPVNNWLADNATDTDATETFSTGVGVSESPPPPPHAASDMSIPARLRRATVDRVGRSSEYDIGNP
jgi:hypothetical protein